MKRLIIRGQATSSSAASEDVTSEDTIGLQPMEFQVQPNKGSATPRYHRLKPDVISGEIKTIPLNFIVIPCAVFCLLLEIVQLQSSSLHSKLINHDWV